MGDSFFKKDVREKFICSSKPGGQNVNKVSSCVSLTHIPTGIQVKVQQQRTQAENRKRAYVLLKEKVEAFHAKKKREAIDKREKSRRQNRKKPKVLKERILEYKHRQSEKKKARKRISLNSKDIF